METSYYGKGLPINISAHGPQIDNLINIVQVFMIVLFVGWFAFMLYTLWRFRARPGHQANYVLPKFRAPSYLEVGVALFEVFLLVALSMPVVHRLKEEFPRSENSAQVRVIAQQFAWNIHYPGADGKFGRTDPSFVDESVNPLGRDPEDPAGKDDITTINQFVIPVHKPVTIFLTSKDVLHSFFLPVARVKQDAIPGEMVPLWFEPVVEGQFEIACAQLCGANHYRMRGDFIVKSQQGYEQWLEQKAASMSNLNKPIEKDEFEAEEFGDDAFGDDAFE